MKRGFLYFTLIFVFVPAFSISSESTAVAETLAGDSPACLSEALYDQLTTAQVERDRRAWDYLLKNGCIVTKADFHASIIKWLPYGRVKVRVYVEDSAFILWTSASYIQ